ncbi:MAG: hypothetical protein H6720_11415 [Sandaracinus sp.]|nr:hypothetical protein [Sandaracinus sp.]
MNVRPRWLPLLLLLGACDCGSNPSPARCDVDTPCEGGESCVDGLCVPNPDASTDGAPTDAPSTDAPPPDVPMVDAGPCRAISGESTLEPSPVDILVMIDNSGSMTQEAEQTRANMNRFAEILGMSGLDYRVVLISRPDGDTGVCIPAPLGSGEPDCGSGPEGRLLAIHQAIGSRNAPEIMLARYPDYVDFLRPEAVKVLIWITDDQARDTTADAIRANLAALEPAGMFDDTIHNAIVGFYGDTPATWGDEGAGMCGSLARVGSVYLRLAGCYDNDDMPIAECTPGLAARVCETDWTEIFEGIAAAVVRGVPVQCEFPMPAAPDGMTINYEDVRVSYTRGDGTNEALMRVADEAACTDGAWYYDDPAMPTEVRLCPALCTRVQADEGARMDVGLGCFPILD